MSKKLKKLKILKEIIEKNEGITIKDILKTKEIKELRGEIQDNSYYGEISNILNTYTNKTGNFKSHNKTGEIYFKKIKDHKNINSWYLENDLLKKDHNFKKNEKNLEMKKTKEKIKFDILFKIIKNNPGISIKDILKNKELKTTKGDYNDKIFKWKITDILDQYTYNTGIYNRLNEKEEIYFRKEIIERNQYWFLNEKNSNINNKINTNINLNINENLKKMKQESKTKKELLKKRDNAFIERAKKYFFEEDDGKCQLCKIDLYEKYKLKKHYIEMHHIEDFAKSIPFNKNYKDLEEIKEDFEFLCPNCHVSKHLEKK